MQISPPHVEELRHAKYLLENPSLAARLTDKVGAPIEKTLVSGFALLPGNWPDAIREAVNSSLQKALEVAVKSLGKTDGPTQERFHTLAAITAGATGGAFGLPGLLVELPISTTIIFRSIADIARGEGEDISSVETKLACLEVFALGGNQARMTLLKQVTSRFGLLWQNRSVKLLAISPKEGWLKKEHPP